MESGSNSLPDLGRRGQSLWLESSHRELIQNGEIHRLIVEDGLKGIYLSVPSLGRALGGGTEYDSLIAAHVLGRSFVHSGADIGLTDLVRALIVEQARDVADLLRPVFERTRGIDGYVCVPVPGIAAGKTELSESELRVEAHEFCREIGRRNCMLSLPAVPSGIAAAEALLAEGVSVYLSPVFSVAVYRACASALARASEKAYASNVAVGACVAGMPMRPLESLIDTLVEDRIRLAGDGAEGEIYREARGKGARQAALRLYSVYRDFFGAGNWPPKGAPAARPLRLAWSELCRFPEEAGCVDDVAISCVDPFVAPETLLILREEEMDRFRSAPVPMGGGPEFPNEAYFAELSSRGIDIDEISEILTARHLEEREKRGRELFGAIARRRGEFLSESIDTCAFRMPAELRPILDEHLSRWPMVEGCVFDWSAYRDVSELRTFWPELERIQEKIRSEGIREVWISGEKGLILSTLALYRVLPRALSAPPLRIRPGFREFRAGEDRDHGRTLFVTDEPTVLREGTASRIGIQEILTVPGGTALSPLSFIPAALAGADVAGALDWLFAMERSCAPDVPPRENPGLILGIALGVLSAHGRSRLDLIVDEPLAAFGDWLAWRWEARRTGSAIALRASLDEEFPPEAGEACFGAQERIFVHLELEASETVAGQDVKRERVRALLVGLEESGHAVFRIRWRDFRSVCQELLRWELAAEAAAATHAAAVRRRFRAA